MEEMLFIGGAPYSGKTTLCKILKNKNPEKYSVFSLDDFYAFVEHDSKNFFHYATLSSPETVGAYLDDFNSIDAACLDIKQQELKSDLMDIELMGMDMWTLYLQQTMFACLTDKLMDASTNTIPLIESLFFDSDKLFDVYDALKEMNEIINDSRANEGLPTRTLDFDSMKKTLVFLDYGLDVCLERFREDTIHAKGSLMNEELIKKVYELTKIPEKHVLPNLDVIVISDETQLSEFIERMY